MRYFGGIYGSVLYVMAKQVTSPDFLWFEGDAKNACAKPFKAMTFRACERSGNNLIAFISQGRHFLWIFWYDTTGSTAPIDHHNSLLIQ